MLSPNDCIGECLAKFKTGSEVFYDLRHQTIFDALAEAGGGNHHILQ